MSDGLKVRIRVASFAATSVSVDATSMSSGKLDAIAAGIAKVVASTGISGAMALTNGQDASELAALFGAYGGTTATVVATGMTAAQLAEVAANVAKIANDGITGTLALSTTGLDETQIAALLGAKTAAAATVNVDATAMDSNELTAVGNGIGKVDNLLIDSTHGVTAAAADITGKTLAVTGSVAATDFLTVTGTGGADTINLANVTTTNASGVVVGGGSADAITFGTGSFVLAQSTAADSGAFTAPVLNTISTTGFDVITGFNAGDAIKLNASYTGIAGAANGLIAVPVTANTLIVGGLLVDNTVLVVKGTYDSGTNTFAGDALGADAFLIYDAAGALLTSAYEAVVLVGAGSLTALGGNLGLIAFT